LLNCNSRWCVSDPLARFACVSQSRGEDSPKAAQGAHTPSRIWNTPFSRGHILRRSEPGNQLHCVIFYRASQAFGWCNTSPHLDEPAEEGCRPFWFKCIPDCVKAMSSWLPMPYRPSDPEDNALSSVAHFSSCRLVCF